MGAKVETAESLRDAGNAAFKEADYGTAVDKYTEALQLCTPSDGAVKATLHRNRAQARLKRDDYEGAEQDCTQALEFDGADTKALYRRAIAREQLDNIVGAFADAKEALRLQPKGKADRAIEELLARLVKLNTDRQKEKMSLAARANDMSQLVFGGSAKDLEQKRKAVNNLLVLARDSESGAAQVWGGGKLVDTVLNALKSRDEDAEVLIQLVRVLDECAKNNARAMWLLEHLGAPTVTRLPTLRTEDEFVDATGVVIQRVINSTAQMDRSKEQKPDPDVAEKNKLWIVRLLNELQEMLIQPTISAKVRETVIDLLVKNLMHMDGGLPRGWSWRWVEGEGLLRLLSVSSQCPELADYPVTAETRQHVAICLTRLHDDMVFDTKRTIFREKLDLFFNALTQSLSERRSRIKLACMMCTLLQGPVDLGISLVTNDTVTRMMLEMASDDQDKLAQSIAAELIVLTISKYERATTMIKVGLPILRKLYDSEDENIKVRALVGLCKCAAAGGDDASRTTLKEGSALKLANTCKKFLLDVETFSVDVRRFACEGLSYLSLDADVKEMIVADEQLLKSLLELAKSAGALCVYTLASIYVNLSNAYEKPKVEEEMVKLAQFAKHHVPEVHPKDTDDYVEKRINALVRTGAVTACVAVHKTESKNALDLLCRALAAFSEHEPLRGQMLSEGACKLLLHLYNQANGDGKIKAAHALARLGSKADPQIAFPGQRSYEVVKPIVELLHPDIDGRPNYDALLTLTNLASVSDSVRRRILKEKAVPKVEEYWFMTDHPHLRAAAAELLLNLLFLEDFYKETTRKGTDRLKLWVLYSADEDERLASASAAGFAILTEDADACRRIFDEISTWRDVFKDIVMHECPEVQRRGLIGIANVMESDQKLCAEIVASEVFHILVAITKLRDQKGREEAVKLAQRALAAAEKYGHIAATAREKYERENNLSTVAE